MICLRCGYCCKNYLVAIVDNPDKGLEPGNIKVLSGDGTPCPHLQGSKSGNYSCAVHDQPWYIETPCYAHGQTEQGNTNCRIGEYVMKKAKENS